MTIEEANTFLDNLKVCIEEHPIVADWLIEIADRKTENCSEIPNNCEPQTSGVVWTEDAIKDEPKSYTTWVSTDEPQAEQQTKRPWGMYIIEHPMYE